MESVRDPGFFLVPLEVTKKHQEIVARGFESLLQPWLLGLQNCGDGGCGGGIFPLALCSGSSSWRGRVGAKKRI